MDHGNEPFWETPRGIAVLAGVSSSHVSPRKEIQVIPRGLGTAYQSEEHKQQVYPENGAYVFYLFFPEASFCLFQCLIQQSAYKLGMKLFMVIAALCS